MNGINKPRVRPIVTDGDADRFMVTVAMNGVAVTGIAQLSNCERALVRAGREGEVWYKICKKIIELKRDLEAMQR